MSEHKEVPPSVIAFLSLAPAAGIGAVVGGVVGGLLAVLMVIILVVLVMWCVIVKRSTKSSGQKKRQED